METGALVVFVKTPGYSEIKTRLALSLGKQKAEEVYLSCVGATKAVVKQSLERVPPYLTAYWAVAEDEALSHPMWSEFETVEQGDGGLGEKLHSVYERLSKKHDFVICIGADSPHMRSRHIIKAAELLCTKGNSFVMGRARDGGFYLFAGNKNISKDVWCSVPYGVSTTAQALIKQLPREGKLVEIDTLQDIDYYGDLCDVIKQMKKEKDYLHEQLEFSLRFANLS